MNPEIDTHISRDAIRFSLLKDNMEYFEVENQVRRSFFKQIEECTRDESINNSVFIDATHLTPKSRRQVRNCIEGHPYEIAISFEVPLKVALERNSQRSGRALVPETAIYNMYHSYNKPTLKEGFDEVWHIDANGVITKETRE
jgi:predicted kinase